LDVFDGLALASSGVCFFMAWAFLQTKKRNGEPGNGLLALAMLLGACAWGLSATVGAFSFHGDVLAHLLTVIPALVSVACLAVGFLQYATGGALAWKRVLGVLIGCITAAQMAWWLGDAPRWTTDLVVSLLLGCCSLYCLYWHVKRPTAGYFPVAIAFLMQPATMILSMSSGVDLEHVRQLLGVPLALLGVMIFLIGFFRYHDLVVHQLRKIERTDNQLRDMVYLDTVTSLRSAYGQRERMAELLTLQTPFALLAVSLDDFSIINDNLGPAGGDAIIVAAANAIKAAVGDAGELARATGAEFTVLVQNITRKDQLEALAKEILASTTLPLRYSNASIYVDLSIGIACSPGDAQQVDELIRMATVALHEAKERGGRGVCGYEPFLDIASQDKVWMDHNLRLALDGNQFELHFQPKLLLSDQQVTGVEALLRWQHPQRGPIQPDQFIPRAEASGLIVPIGRWVIETASRQAAIWVEQGRPIRIAINLSAKQLADVDLLQFLREAQVCAGGMLDIELTESSLIANERETRSFIVQCRELGFGVHLDDFGTGYSSLSRLGTLPLTLIKLDRSFITPIGRSEKADALVKAVVAIGKELRISIVAEGVETQEQADYLNGLGVRYAQGWLYAPAMASTACESWLMDNRKNQRGIELAPSLFIGLT
jgi:diguanylate cyclase (GGDEF)-like protein